MTTKTNPKITFQVNYIIYEKNDTAILLDGAVRINNKNYYTSIPIDLVRFSHLCEKRIGFQKTNSLWNKLIGDNDQVCEIIPKNHLGEDLIFSTNETFINQHLFQLKTA
ncbi:MAG: hypothetical protein VW078_04945 [Flavobacteriales bacterium]|jgi:hypothetical protein|tara:strand:- start:959 stop:1285 length:327 start_codon:yes stop_codon:yes gene_type:complete